MKFFLRHLELFLTAAGLVVIFGVTALFHPAGSNPWAVAAVTAIAVGVIHGVLFWLVRQRQRHVRQAALSDAQRMLRDVVNNQLAVIRLGIDLHGATGASSRAAIGRLEEAVAAINLAIGDVSEESLARWQSRYNPETLAR